MIDRTEIPSRQPLAVGLLAALAALKLLLHLLTNFRGGYGYFRDELYYLACSDHLAWGYVDQPPLSIFLLAVERTLFGDSIFALRLFPALAGTGTVIFAGLLAREIGGGRFAQGLAALTVVVSTIHLAFDGIYSMNTFDLLLTAAAAYWLARLIRGGDSRNWLLLGVTLGLGLLNKVSVLWFGFGVFVALLTSRERRWLATRHTWIAGGIALAAFVPYVVWNAAHDWAHLEFMANAVAGKYSGLNAMTFLAGLILIHNPPTLIVWLSGIAYLLFARAARPFRPLGIVFVTVLAVLLANGQSKSEYMASAMIIAFAAGGLAFERWLSGPRLRLRPLVVALVAPGLLLAPITLPILPVETLIRYSQTLHLPAATSEGHEMAELHQFYADMFGWPEKAAAVAEVYHALPPEDRERAVILGHNYGRAGAIDFFGPGLELPGAISPHNNYWIWGPGSATGELVIVLGGNRQDLESRFESVEEAGRAECDYCMVYERDLPIFVCRGLKMPIEELWPLARAYG